MMTLTNLWWLCFLIAITVMPVAVIRYVAIGPGGFERSRTMRLSAAFALGVGGTALAATVILGGYLLWR